MIFDGNIFLATTTPAGEVHGNFLWTIFVLFVAVKLAAELFERLKQPAVSPRAYEKIITMTGALLEE